MQRPFLFVLSSHDILYEAGRLTGSWLEELAAPYWILRDAGYEIELASPKGGPAPIDPISLEDDWLTDTGQRFLDDDHASRFLQDTHPLDMVQTRDFLGLLLVGGAAAIWDFTENAIITRIVESSYSDGKVIASISHAAVGLAQATGPLGEAIVKNRELTSISTAEDELMGISSFVPILSEIVLRDLDCNYSCAAPLEPHVVVDLPFITGQNPASAASLGRAILRSLEVACPL